MSEATFKKMLEATAKQVYEKVPLSFIAAGVGLVGACAYGMRVKMHGDGLKSMLLEDHYRLAKHVLKASPRGLLRLQMRISHWQLERTSPTKVLRRYMKHRSIPAELKQSSVLDFYNEMYRNRIGITSSTLGHKEGKTISCLSILANIEKENLNVCNDRKVVFLYGDVDKWPKTTVKEKDSTGSLGPITECLKRTLCIQDDENIGEVLYELTYSKRGHYMIYGLIDQVDAWDPRDKAVLRSLVVQSFNCLRIHIPSAFESVASKINLVNGQQKAVYLGPASPTFRHELNTSQVSDYVKLLTDDLEVQEKIMERAMEHVKNSGYINPYNVLVLYLEEQQ